MTSSLSLMFLSPRKEETTHLSVSEAHSHQRYIPYHSHHHPRTTTGVLRCMRDRARNICHPTKMQQEMDPLNQVFRANGFPENLVKKTLTTHPSPLPERSPELEQLDNAPKILCTPYIRGLSEKIEKVTVTLQVSALDRLSTWRQVL